MNGESQERFARLRQPDWIKPRLQQLLERYGEERYAITTCSIGHTHYKWHLKAKSRSKDRLMVCYHLNLTDGRAASSQALYGKAYLDGRSAQDVAAAQELPLAPPQHGQAVMHAPDLDLALWAFPNDPMLPQLPQLTQSPRASQTFPDGVLPANALAQMDEMAVDIVNYRPEQRCLMRYRLPAAETALTLYAKTFACDAAEAIYRRHNHLWQGSQRDPLSFLMARPLAYDPTTRTIWQQALVGRPLWEALDWGARTPRLERTSILERVAVGLARLHESDLPDLPHCTPVEQYHEVSKKAAKLAVVKPAWQRALQRLTQGLHQQLDRLQAAPLAVAHSDLHIDQLLVCGDGIALFDFDELTLGDPAQDVADFALDLYLRCLESTGEWAWADGMAAAFLKRYRRQAPWPICAPRLHWYFQVKCLTRAYRLYWQQAPDLTRQMECLLRLAERVSTLTGLADERDGTP